MLSIYAYYTKTSAHFFNKEVQNYLDLDKIYSQITIFLEKQLKQKIGFGLAKYYQKIEESIQKIVQQYWNVQITLNNFQQQYMAFLTLKSQKKTLLKEYLNQNRKQFLVDELIVKILVSEAFEHFSETQNNFLKELEIQDHGNYFLLNLNKRRQSLQLLNNLEQKNNQFFIEYISERQGEKHFRELQSKFYCQPIWNEKNDSQKINIYSYLLFLKFNEVNLINMMDITKIIYVINSNITKKQKQYQLSLKSITMMKQNVQKNIFPSNESFLKNFQAYKIQKCQISIEEFVNLILFGLKTLTEFHKYGIYLRKFSLNNFVSDINSQDIIKFIPNVYSLIIDPPIFSNDKYSLSMSKYINKRLIEYSRKSIQNLKVAFQYLIEAQSQKIPQKNQYGTEEDCEFFMNNFSNYEAEENYLEQQTSNSKINKYINKHKRYKVQSDIYWLGYVFLRILFLDFNYFRSFYDKMQNNQGKNIKEFKTEFLNQLHEITNTSNQIKFPSNFTKENKESYYALVGEMIYPNEFEKITISQFIHRFENLFFIDMKVIYNFEEKINREKQLSQQIVNQIHFRQKCGKISKRRKIIKKIMKSATRSH